MYKIMRNNLGDGRGHFIVWCKADPLAMIVFNERKGNSEEVLSRLFIENVFWIHEEEKLTQNDKNEILSFAITNLKEVFGSIISSFIEDFTPVYEHHKFKKIEEADLFVWNKKDSYIKPGVDTDVLLAKWLGWCEIAQEKQGLAVGVQPKVLNGRNGDYLFRVILYGDAPVQTIPSWSTDTAQSLGLLISLESEIGYDYNINYSRERYKVTIDYRDNSYQSEKYLTLALAITDVMIKFTEKEFPKPMPDITNDDTIEQLQEIVKDDMMAREDKELLQQIEEVTGNFEGTETLTQESVDEK